MYLYNSIYTYIHNFYIDVCNSGVHGIFDVPYACNIRTTSLQHFNRVYIYIV